MMTTSAVGLLTKTSPGGTPVHRVVKVDQFQFTPKRQNTTALCLRHPIPIHDIYLDRYLVRNYTQQEP